MKSINMSELAPGHESELLDPLRNGFLGRHISFWQGCTEGAIEAPHLLFWKNVHSE